MHIKVGFEAGGTCSLLVRLDAGANEEELSFDLMKDAFVYYDKTEQESFILIHEGTIIVFKVLFFFKFCY